MPETISTHYDVPADPHLARLALDTHDSHGGLQPHDWEEIHSTLRAREGVFDIEQFSDDTEVRQKAHERAEQSQDADVAWFIGYIDGCMNVAAVSERDLTTQIRTIRRGASCLNGDSVSFELAEHAVDKLAELEARLRMHYPNGDKTVAGSVEYLPDATLKEMYLYPSSPHKNVVAELLDSASLNTPTGLGVHARLLRKIYRQPDGNMQLSHGDMYVKRMMDKLHHNEVMFEIASLPEMPKSKERADVAEFNTDVTRATTEILHRLGVVEIDEEGRDDSAYLKSAFVRLRNRKAEHSVRPAGSVYTTQLKYELSQIYQNLKHIGGPEAAKRLKEVFGVKQLWMYSPEELRMLQRLDEKDPRAIKHLQNGDVTVVFSNAMDDHNGAIVEDANYRKRSGRTLRFEADHVPAIYRQMIYLNSLGIRPATLVYETHGAPGAVTDGGVMLWAAEPRGGIIKHEDKSKDDRVMIPGGNSVHGDGLYRLVRDYMQPNRGIDSDDELKGKKQLIVSACSSDKPTRFADGTNASFVEKIAQMVAYPSDRSIEKGIHSRRGYQKNVVLYGALEDMAEMRLENGRVGFVDHNSETQRTVTTKRSINEPKAADRIFGTSRQNISTHSIRTRKGVPVRRTAS